MKQKKKSENSVPNDGNQCFYRRQFSRHSLGRRPALRIMLQIIQLHTRWVLDCAITFFISFLLSGFNCAYGQATYVARDALYGELGGKAFIYSFYYENLYLDDLGLNLGFSVLPRTMDFSDENNLHVSDDSSTVTIPVFVSWYPLGRRDRLFIDGGMNFLLIFCNHALSTGLLGTVGFGYNYRPREDGYSIKFGPLLILGAGGPRSLGIRVLPWFGVAVGKVF